MEFAKIFQSGGPFMYPILIVFAIGMAITIERFFFLMRTHSRTQKVWSQLTPMLLANDYEKAKAFTKDDKTPLAVILNYGFSRQKPNVKRKKVEMAMEEGMMEALPSLEERTHYLATFANIATLLGLLGTIVGLIQAFTAVASADPADKANLLSASISVAMNTTAFGLIVAIPLLLTHSYLSTRTSKMVNYLEMATVKCLNLMDLDED